MQLTMNLTQNYRRNPCSMRKFAVNINGKYGRPQTPVQAMGQPPYSDVLASYQ